jgi:hypothetical protein
MSEFDQAVFYIPEEPCLHGHSLRYVNNDKCVQCKKNSYAKHKEKDAATQKRYRASNPGKTNAAKLAYVGRNPDAVREHKRNWAKRNRESQNAHTRNWRANRRNADGVHTREEIEAIYDRQKHKCAACGKKAKLTADHYYPLSRGGTNHAKNIQGLCLSCNSAKNNKHPIDFMQSRGFLL